MEVRGVLLAEIHLDHDTEEPTDLWHGAIRAGGGSSGGFGGSAHSLLARHIGERLPQRLGGNVGAVGPADRAEFGSKRTRRK